MSCFVLQNGTTLFVKRLVDLNFFFKQREISTFGKVRQK